jgi:hypothetical protein
MSAVSTWSSDIDNASKLLGIGLTDMVRLLALHIFTGVVQKTPVDEGYLRAAWNVSLNRPEFITVAGEKGDSSLINSMAGGGMNMGGGSLGLFPRIFITNGLPYAAVVEYGLYPGIGDKTVEGQNPMTGGGAFSRQAPKGMLEVTLNDVRTNLRKIVGN